MKVTVSFEDSYIVVDGKAITFEKGALTPPIDDATLEPFPWQILSWEDISGRIQIERRESQFITDFSVIEPYLEKFRAAEKEEEA